MCQFVLCQGRNSEQKLSLSSLRALGVSCRVVHRSITLAQMSWPKQPWRHRRHTKLHVDRGARGTRNRPPSCTSSTCITTHHIRTLYRVMVIERLYEVPILELILGCWGQSFIADGGDGPTRNSDRLQRRFLFSTLYTSHMKMIHKHESSVHFFDRHGMMPQMLLLTSCH